MFEIGLTHFILVSFALFSAGIATILTKRNAIGILLGVELIVNAAALNFAAFNHYVWGQAIDGQMFALFIIVLAAAEAAIALAIILNFYNHFSTVDVDQADQLKG